MTERAVESDEFEWIGQRTPEAENRHFRHYRHTGTGLDISWESPDLALLGTGRRPAPSFPLRLMGPWVQWVEARAKGASAPADYVAVALLASVGASIGNARWPLAGASWSEPPLLWCAEVGPPSSAKSPSMDAVFSLIRYAEDGMAVGFEAEQRQHAVAKQVSEAQLDAWKGRVKAAVKGGMPAPLMPEDARAPDAPVRPRIRVADATVEALGVLAAAQPRGLLLVRDELSGWLGAFDRYGGGGSDRAFAIEMYGGRSYIVDRMKNPEPLRIRHLSIGVLGGVQPEKLSAILEGPDDGLAARLLWAWPDAMPEFSLSRATLDDAPAQRHFARLAELPMDMDPMGHPMPRRVRLTLEAEDALEHFAREMIRKAQGSAGILAGAIGKARGHALRLSAVLQFMWWSATDDAPEPANISLQAMDAAIALLEGYFLPMAERVFGDAVIPAAEKRAMAVAKHLRAERIETFNARDLRREMNGPVREPADMDSACEALVEAGLIRPRQSRTGSGKGRPAKNYEVNPAVTAPSERERERP